MNQTLEVLAAGYSSYAVLMSLLISVSTSLQTSIEPRVYLLYLQSGLVVAVSVELKPSLVVRISFRCLGCHLNPADYCLPVFFIERMSVSAS